MSEPTLEEIKYRYQLAEDAASKRLTTHTLVDTAIYEYTKHLAEGESWGSSFRFPEIMGVANRKYNNLVQILPECKFKGKDDNVVATQSAYDDIVDQSNVDRVKKWAIKSAINYGLGCFAVYPKVIKQKFKDQKDEEVIYDGLVAEFVDERDIFPAHTAITLHDVTTVHRCPYIFRRRIYHADTFFRIFNDKKYNLTDVQPSGFTSGVFSTRRDLTKAEAREKDFGGKYVTVMEYIDVENDMYQVYASGREEPIYECPKGLDFSHKQIPYHFYWNYKKDDSIEGISEIELNYPYTLYREIMFNLKIKNDKLALQPCWIKSGNVDFNPENNPIHPGAFLNLKGLNNGKIQDAITPFNPSTGMDTRGFMETLQTIENSRISVTADDTTALYSNPNQLATQTLAKKETLNKTLDANILDNTLDSEYYLTGQIFSYLKHELAKSVEKRKGKKTFRRITVKGFDVVQNKDTSGAKFKKRDNAMSEFYLNPKVAEQMEETDYEIISAKQDEELKRDRNEKRMMFFQYIAQIAQLNPELMQKMQFTELMKQTLKDLGYKTEEVFMSGSGSLKDIDPVEYEHVQMWSGINPPNRSDENPIEEAAAHRAEIESANFKKNASKTVKDTFNKHIIQTYEYAKKQMEKPIEAQKMEQEQSMQPPVPGPAGQVPPTGGAGQISGVPGVPPVPQASMQASGTGVPIPMGQ